MGGREQGLAEVGESERGESAGELGPICGDRLKWTQKLGRSPRGGLRQLFRASEGGDLCGEDRGRLLFVPMREEHSLRPWDILQ